MLHSSKYVARWVGGGRERGREGRDKTTGMEGWIRDLSSCVCACVCRYVLSLGNIPQKTIENLQNLQQRLQRQALPESVAIVGISS